MSGEPQTLSVLGSKRFLKYIALGIYYVQPSIFEGIHSYSRDYSLTFQDILLRHN